MTRHHAPAICKANYRPAKFERSTNADILATAMFWPMARPPRRDGLIDPFTLTRRLGGSVFSLSPIFFHPPAPPSLFLLFALTTCYLAPCSYHSCSIDLRVCGGRLPRCLLSTVTVARFLRLFSSRHFPISFFLSSVRTLLSSSVLYCPLLSFLLCGHVSFFNLLRWNNVSRTSRIFSFQNCNILSVLSIFKQNKIGKTNNKFITFQQFLSSDHHADEFKKKATNYYIRFGRSLWSAISSQIATFSQF